MTHQYGDWLDTQLGKPLLWSKHAATTAIARDIYSEDVKNAILFGKKVHCESTETGNKVTVIKELHDPLYKALIIIYLDLTTHYYIISNHHQRRKRGMEND